MPRQPDTTSDDQLWEAIRRDDADALTALVRKYSRSLASYGRKLTPDHELVKDCIQDLFADLWIYRNRLAIQVSVQAYLLISLRRKILRARKTSLLTSPLESESDPLPFLVCFSVQDQWIESEMEQQRLYQLNQVVNSLPARQKEILYLKFYQNLSHQEIADLLDIQYQSVSNLLHRALVHLRQHWKEEFSLSLLICVLF